MPLKQKDRRNALIEIVPGVGGQEAQAWADDVEEMLRRYAKRLGFRVEEFQTIHGSRQIIVQGREAYAVFKYEAGIHEVQRTPRTDHYGRIHSSTASVIVLPEVQEEEYAIQQSDLRMEIYQGAETLHPGVSITHRPSGIRVSVQSSKNETENIQTAMRLLRARLYHLNLSQRKRGFSFMRKQQRATGQRAERIRTYNYKEGRVRDHRTGIKSMQLRQIMDGRLDQFTIAMREREEQQTEAQEVPAA